MNNVKDLEWLGWNWNLKKSQETYSLKKQMVFHNFNQTVPFLPSISEIIFGLVLAQIEKYKELQDGLLLWHDSIEEMPAGKMWN